MRYTIFICRIKVIPEPGNLIGTVTVAELASGSAGSYEIVWIPDTDGITYVYGVVEYELDMNTSNNQTPDYFLEVFGPSATSGGPDEFGYMWFNSNDDNGPEFDWITPSGTEINGFIDDNHVGPFPIGFNFPFYEDVHTQFYVQSNGCINFDDDYLGITNQNIPVEDSYNNQITGSCINKGCIKGYKNIIWT